MACQVSAIEASVSNGGEDIAGVVSKGWTVSLTEEVGLHLKGDRRILNRGETPSDTCFRTLSGHSGWNVWLGWSEAGCLVQRILPEFGEEIGRVWTKVGEWPWRELVGLRAAVVAGSREERGVD